MASTALPFASSAIPWPAYPAVVQTKVNWSDSWTPRPELELEHVTLAAGGHDLDSAVVRHRYGYLKQPYNSSFAAESPENLDQLWIQIGINLSSGFTPVFTGMVFNDGREVFGASVQETGHQRFQCHGGGVFLRRRAISQSVWQLPTAAQGITTDLVAWSAPMNSRIIRHGWVVGNRSSSKINGVYCFGGNSAWSANDFIQYLLNYFMDESSSGGPSWSLSDPTGVLAALKICKSWPETTTAAEMIQELISPRLGIDYLIAADDGGFTVTVFALQASATTIGGVTLPANPDTVTHNAGVTTQNLTTRISLNSDQLYGTIRVLGKQVVIATTLVAPDAAIASGSPLYARRGSLAPAWATALQTAYLAGTATVPPPAQYPAGSAAAADYNRRRDRYRDVFRLWLMPAGYDLHKLGAVLKIDTSSGTANVTQIQADGSTGPDTPWQSQHRKTLRWTPMQSGFNYSVNPPTNPNPDPNDDDDFAPQFIPPAAWLWSETDGWITADSVGVAVAVPKQGLGIRLHCTPAHLVAADQAVTNTLTPPKWGMNWGTATVAFESDLRLMMEYGTGDYGQPGVDGVEEIVVPDAELWILAANTMIGVLASDATQEQLSPNVPVVLRDDTPRLAQVMAGAVARYNSTRARAEVVAAALLPWQALLGQMLSVIQAGGDSQQINSPITRITWTGGQRPTTRLEAGFANRG